MSEYLPLAKLIEQGLQEGTGLELRGEVDILYKWSKGEVLLFTGNPVSGWNPLAMEFKWRIVSTPPKKITFETSPLLVQRGEKYVQVLEVPVDGPWMHALNCEEDYIVTVEEKR